MEMLKIRNPKASFSYVKVKPHQEFVINFSSMNEIVDVTWASDYFDLMEDVDNVMRFQQLYPDIMEDWARHSSVVLGEIWVVRTTGRSNLVVVLEQTTPKVDDILTVIDPDIITLSLRPKQILEVVLRGSKASCCYRASEYTRTDRHFSFHDCSSQCFYENIAAVEVDVNDDRIVCNYINGILKKESYGTYEIKLGKDIGYKPILPKISGCAKHFWYKISLAGVNWPAGSYDIGKICCKGDHEGQININLKLRRKDTVWRSTTRGLLAPTVQNTIIPYCKDVVLKEIDGDFEDCETIEYVGENKIIRTPDNRIIVCKPYSEFPAREAHIRRLCEHGDSMFV